MNKISYLRTEDVITKIWAMRKNLDDSKIHMVEESILSPLTYYLWGSNLWITKITHEEKVYCVSSQLLDS